MRNTLFGAATALLILSQTCEAGLLITLSHNAADLNNLSVGQTVRFDVSLNGLGVMGNPTELSNLNVDVLFSSVLFGTPTLVTAGSIIPDATNTFTPVSNPGGAGAIFDNILLMPPDPTVTIDSDGLFFSFLVTAQATGSGFVLLDPPASGFDANNDPITIDSSESLSYRITVPEPSTLFLVCLAMVFTVGFRKSAMV